MITAATSLGYPRTGQDKAVVLFTEDDLTDFVKADEVPFPIPYRLHADVLRSIANAKPEAIFIDFAFIQQTRAHDEQFAALKLQVCRAHRTVIHEDRKPDRLTKVFVVDTSQLGLAGITAETFGGCATPVGAFIDREHIAVGVMTYPKSGNAPRATARRSRQPCRPALPVDASRPPTATAFRQPMRSGCPPSLASRTGRRRPAAVVGHCRPARPWL